MKPKQNEEPIMKSHSRRRFLQQATAACLTAPLFVPNLISQPPSRRVRHASFGASGMAGADIDSITSHKSVQLVCVAEVDTSRQAAFRKQFPKATIYQDWRVMLDKEGKNLDS